MASEEASEIRLVGSPLPLPRQPTILYVQDPDAYKERLVMFRNERAYTDVLLKVGLVEIPCHRVILAAGSEYFNQMFRTNQKESTRGKIKVDSLDPNITKSIIDFFYTGKLEINTENVKVLIEACNLLRLDHLKRASDEFMSKLIMPSNSLSMYMFAKANDLDIAMKVSFKCMLTRPRAILTQASRAEYQALSEDELIRYISDDDLEVDDECLVFQLVEKWVGVDQSREAAFENVLEHVRLPFCNLAYLCNVVEMCPLADTRRCRLLIKEAKDYHLLPESRSSMNTQRARPRAANEKIIVAGGLSAGNTTNRDCWLLGANGSSWENFTQLPTDFTGFVGALVVGHEIVVTGGCSANFKAVTRECWSLNICEKTWKSLPSLLAPRRSHALLCYNDHLYVCGGCTNGSDLDSCETLDAKRQKWIDMPPLIQATVNPAAATHKGHLYVIGGYGAPSLMQHFSASTNKWQRKADLPIECSYGPSAVVLNENIYVTGGVNNVCLCYDPRQDSWTSLSKPNCPHRMGRATAWRGKIVICGGTDENSKTLDTIEEYDVRSNNWSTWNLCLQKAIACHVVLNTVPRV